MKITDTPRTKSEARIRRRQVQFVLSIITVIAVFWVMFPGQGTETCHLYRNADGSTTPADFDPRDAFECAEFVEISR